MTKDNSPTFDQSVVGYALAALRMAEIPPETIGQVITELRVVLDSHTPAEAVQIAASSPY